MFFLGDSGELCRSFKQLSFSTLTSTARNSTSTHEYDFHIYTIFLIHNTKFKKKKISFKKEPYFHAPGFSLINYLFHVINFANEKSKDS